MSHRRAGSLRHVVRWLAEQTTSGVRELRFDTTLAGAVVPGLLWLPDPAKGPRPLVLIGHGAPGHKRHQVVPLLGRRLVRRHGFAAAAIDGPVHGDRRLDGGRDDRLVMLEFAQMWHDDPAMTDRAVAEWQAVRRELQERDDVGEGPVGYWGLSMGTILGLPFVAAEPAVRAAVLGLMGLTGPTRDRLAADAPRITCPVLFLVQQTDEVFTRPQSLDLFDAIGSKDKRLHLNLGAHSQVPDRELRQTEDFLVERLGRPAAAGPGRGACRAGRDQEPTPWPS